MYKEKYLNNYTMDAYTWLENNNEVETQKNI